MYLSMYRMNMLKSLHVVVRADIQIKQCYTHLIDHYLEIAKWLIYVVLYLYRDNYMYLA